MSSPFFVNKKLKVLPLDTYQKIPITKGKTFTKFKKKFDITNQLKYSFSQADGLPVSRNLKHNMTKTAPHHTVLFNVAGITMLHLTKHELDQVYDIIECTMNGDGLYEGYDKEDILAGYYHQENPFGHMTWIDLIKMILSENTINIRMVCRNTFVADPIIEINDDAAWYEKYNGFMTETP